MSNVSADRALMKCKLITEDATMIARYDAIMIRSKKVELQNGEYDFVVRLPKQRCEDPLIVSIDAVVIKD